MTLRLPRKSQSEGKQQRSQTKLGTQSDVAAQKTKQEKPVPRETTLPAHLIRSPHPHPGAPEGRKPSVELLPWDTNTEMKSQ